MQHAQSDRRLPHQQLGKIGPAYRQPLDVRGARHPCCARGIREQRQLTDKASWSSLQDTSGGQHHLDRAFLDDEQTGAGVATLGEHIRRRALEFGGLGGDVRQRIFIQRGK